MATIICVQCKEFMKVKKNGVCWEEGMPIGQNGEWGPYKLWMADLYKCQGCGVEMLFTQATQQPVAEHFEADYKEQRERYAPIITVNDCPGCYI